MYFSMKYLKLYEFFNEYNEGPESTFIHNNKEYSVDKLILITKNAKSCFLAVDDLKWVLEYTEVEFKRVLMADLQFSIIVNELDGQLVVFDGMHRL